MHALAYQLGGEFKISHGMSNSVLLPFVMYFNLPSCTDRYAVIAEILGLSGSTDEELAAAAIRALRKLSERCGIPGDLKSIGIPEEAISRMASAALEVKRLLDNNPRRVTQTDAESIYRNAYNGQLPT